MKTQSNNSHKKLAVLLLVLAVVVLGAVYLLFAARTQSGSKEVSVTVVDDQGEETSYSCRTDAQYLEEVLTELEEEGLTFSGTESSYGLMIDTVNGLRADYNEDGAYWYFYVNGEDCMYGVSSQPVQDGDAFEIVYTLAE